MTCMHEIGVVGDLSVCARARIAVQRWTMEGTRGVFARWHWLCHPVASEEEQVERLLSGLEQIEQPTTSSEGLKGAS